MRLIALLAVSTLTAVDTTHQHADYHYNATGAWAPWSDSDSPPGILLDDGTYNFTCGDTLARGKDCLKALNYST